MDANLKTSGGSQVGPVDTDELTVAQMTETQHERARAERGLEDDNAHIQRPSTYLSADSTICDQCSHLDLLGALQKATKIRERESDSYDRSRADHIHGILSHRFKEREGDSYDRSRALEDLLYYHGIRIAQVGHRFREPQSTDCTLCSVLFASRICRDRLPASGDDGDEVRLFGFLHYSELARWPTCFQDYESAFLAVVPSQFGSNSFNGDNLMLKNHVYNEGAAILQLVGDSPAMFSAQEVPDVFDVDTVNMWLQYCISNHSTMCSSSKSAIVSGLRLIDCVDLSVTEVESNKPYVALSYVWGKPCDVNSTSRRTRNGFILPTGLSVGISDAIKVTKALGFRYLWVDRFCIDQQNPEGKHEQIKQMHAIYENADLVIVAAAGVDGTYGLPGVSQTPRTPQRTAKFNGLRVIPIMKDPQSAIRSSRWASRGWTFQEAAFSRRLLFFTDQQLYFECNTMSCFENVYSPLDKLHGINESDVDFLGRKGMFSSLAHRMRPPNIWSSVPATYRGKDSDTLSNYVSSVKEYSSRDLSYDSDSLNAFQGIIQRYSELERPLNAIWGMPYSAQAETRTRYFCCALSWNHRCSRLKTSKLPRRRPDFPSWAWTGWEGAVHITPDPLLRREFKSGIQSIRFADKCQAKQENLDSFSCTTRETEWRVLRLFSRTLLPRESWKPADNEMTKWSVGGYMATLFPSDDCMREVSFVHELTDVEKWRCIWVCHIHSSGYVMILKRKQGNERWERAGMFEITLRLDSDIARFAANQAIEPIWSDIE